MILESSLSREQVREAVLRRILEKVRKKISLWNLEHARGYEKFDLYNAFLAEWSGGPKMSWAQKGLMLCHFSDEAEMIRDFSPTEEEGLALSKALLEMISCEAHNYRSVQSRQMYHLLKSVCGFTGATRQ